jgi:hypothetical protein
MRREWCLIGLVRAGEIVPFLKLSHPPERLVTEFNPIRGWRNDFGSLNPALKHGANGVETHTGFFDAVGDGALSHSISRTLGLVMALSEGDFE